MVKQLLVSFLCAISLACLFTGCGGSSSSNMVDLKVTVPATGALKKSKFSKSVSVTKVTGVVLEDGTEVSGDDQEGTFTVRVPKGSDVHIQATVTDENSSEFTFESYVKDAEDSDQVVDEDSTRVANLLVYEGVKGNTSVKDLMLSEDDVVARLKLLLTSFQNRDALNELLADASSSENIDDLANKVEELISKLKEINRILENFDKRLEQFSSSNDVVRFGVISEADIINNEADEEGESDVINEFLVRPSDVKGIAVGEMTGSNADASRSTVSINEDGSVSVERDGETSTTDSVLTKDRFSGRFISFSENVLIIGANKRSSETKEEFYISNESKDLIVLAESFQENDSIAISFATNDEGRKTVKAIFAEGFINGTLTALTKTSVTITLSNGLIVEMPIKDYSDRVASTLSSARANGKADVESTDPVIATTTRVEETGEESTDPVIVTTTSVESTDVESILFNMEDNNTIEVGEAEVKIGDLVIVHWKVVKNVKVALGIFADLPISIDDPKPVVDAVNPIHADDEQETDEDGVLDIK